MSSDVFLGFLMLGGFYFYGSILNFSCFSLYYRSVLPSFVLVYGKGGTKFVSHSRHKGGVCCVLLKLHGVLGGSLLWRVPTEIG